VGYSQTAGYSDGVMSASAGMRVTSTITKTPAPE
jgi:hypothetical protein